jgi:hypothetical protein
LQPRGQQINHLEALAMACARATFPEALLGKRVVHFVDNTVALSAAVHGYANEPDRAHGRRSSINALNTYDAALACDAWFEWVPSGANIADLPSRHAATWSAESAELIAD